MRHKLVGITNKNFRYVNYWDSEGRDDNSDDRRRMAALLRKVMDDGLTEKQRYCLQEYYLNNRSMKNIASGLGVYPSTVTRHIQSAEKKLRKIAKYYQ